MDCTNREELDELIRLPTDPLAQFRACVLSIVARLQLQMSHFAERKQIATIVRKSILLLSPSTSCVLHFLLFNRTPKNDPPGNSTTKNNNKWRQIKRHIRSEMCAQRIDKGDETFQNHIMIRFYRPIMLGKFRSNSELHQGNVHLLQ